MTILKLNCKEDQTMKIRTNHALSLIILMSSISAQAFFDFDELIDDQIKFFQDMKESMHKARKAIRNAFDELDTKEAVTLDIKENDQENNVTITLKGIKSESFDANLSDENDLLAITTDNQKIKIYTENRYLSVELKEEKRQETTQENDTKQKYVSYGSSSMMTGRTLAVPVQLEEQTVNYDKTNQILTITIPQAQQKRAGKPVTVNIIEKEQEASQDLLSNEK